MPAPAILLAIPFLSGAAAAIFLFDSLDERFPFITAAAALLSLVAAVGSALQDDVPEACGAVILGSLLAGLSLGTDAARGVYDTPLLRWFERVAPVDSVVIEGVLREDAAPTPFGFSISVDVTSVGGHRKRGALLGGVRLTVGGTLAGPGVARLRAGRTIRAPAFLRRPSTYLNPGTSDERRPLARRGIVLVGSVKSGALVEVVRRGPVLREWAAALRAWTRARISAHMARLDVKSAGVTTAVLIGDRSGLSAEDERRLQDAGTYHVIAISGGNIAILAVLGLFACRAMLLPSRLAAVLTALALVFYGIVAAGAASVTRAVTVAVVVLAGRALDHRGASLNALAVAAIIAVAVSPVAVLDAGFILSFGATAGIVLGVPVLATAAHEGQWAASMGAARQVGVWLAALFAATVCAEVVLAPVGATLFGRVPLAGLLLNFAAIPLMTIVQIAGLLILATSSWFPGAADAAGWAAYLAASGLLQSSRLVEAAPWLTADVRPPAWGLIVGYYGSALGLLLPRLRRAAAVSLLAVGAVMLAGPSMTARDAVPAAHVPLRAVILDVGQGDATVVQLPGGRTLLVDTGGLAAFSTPDSQESRPAFDVGERVVTPALRALGSSRLDAVVITHGDPDHLLGAKGVLRHVSATSVWEGIPVPPHAGLQGLATVARARGMTWRTLQAGDSERFGEVEVRVLHPALPDWERQRVRNEDSVVLELRVGMVSIVLPGDIGKEAEQAILPRLEAGRLVVLKAPHHGSATSSTKELLDVLRPAAVVFSCGRDNRFGHPHPAVVRRYRELGSEIFSTAQDGSVFVESDGRNVEVRGWAGRRAEFSAPHPK